MDVGGNTRPDVNTTLLREWVPEDDVVWRCEGNATAPEQGGWVRKGSDCTSPTPAAAMLPFFILVLRAI